MIKKIIWGILGIIALALIWNYELVAYGYMQAKGQLSIIFNAKPITEFLADPNTPDSLKQKINYIQEVRQYAIDSLGINDSDSYTTLYDQKGKPVLWIVTACEPFALKAKSWNFPLIGSFSYKGFFVEEKAESEAEKLKKQGYDARVGSVNAWSTLGWLNDPILSNMLFRGDGSLAELIIHELTHGTLYVKDSVEFNENLATFVGEKGAEKFLAYKFGADSEQLKRYTYRGADDSVFTNYFLTSAKRLDSLYNTMSPILPRVYKQKLKDDLIQTIVEDLKKLPLQDSERVNKYLSRNLPDNTFFMSYIRYNAQQNTLEDVFKKQFDSDFDRFLSYYKERFPSL